MENVASVQDGNRKAGVISCEEKYLHRKNGAAYYDDQHPDSAAFLRAVFHRLFNDYGKVHERDYSGKPDARFFPAGE